MRIQSLQLDSFAGLSNRQVTFRPGLNVLLGPNEAGKSTLVDAVFMTLFRDTNLGKNTKEYREIGRYMPIPNGTSIRTALTVTDGRREYILQKEWGSEPRTDLQVAGRLLRDPKEIRALLNDLLVFGEGTYDKIVFAKQRGFQDVLERLVGDPEAANTLSGVLRQAVMELDGVSVEELKSRIENAYSDLADHWDRVAQRPEGNRGIHNPWKTKVGRVLQKYYEKEQLKYDLGAARDSEERYMDAAETLKEKTAYEKELNEKIRVLTALENDMTRRASLEMQLAAQKKEKERLQQVSKEYPVRQARVAQGQEEHQKLTASLATIEAELKQAEALAGIAADVEILQRAKDLETKISAEELAIAQIAQFTDEVVRKLEVWERQQRDATVAMAAAHLQGTYLAGKRALQLQDGLGKVTEITPGSDFSADGYFRMRIGDDTEIEVASGEIDYQNLIIQHQEAADKIRGVLEQLPADSVDSVRSQNERRKEKKGTLDNLTKTLADLMQGRNRVAMQENVDRMQGASTRPRAELEKLRVEASTHIARLESEMKQNTQILQQWEQDYGDLDKLLDLAASAFMKMQAAEQAIHGLPELPPEFKDAADFKHRLEQYRAEADRLKDQLDAVRSAYYAVKNELAQMDSPEELSTRLADAENAFVREQTNLENMFRVRAAFHSTLAGMDQNTFAPLVSAFGQYLSILTDGRYSTGEIQESLAVEITRQDGVNVPASLLSMGTYDCVSLAFRLAVLDHIFVEKPGLLILDDCLVNMDANRRKQAVALIQTFAEENQVIFSTCNPEIAHALGGHIIQV